MKKVLIIGGGLAGLSAAVFLARKGIKTVIIESSPAPGGRARSFTDTRLNAEIDNGQHLMMGCYKETLNFFDIIGAKDNIEIQDNLSAKFAERGGRIFQLDASPLFYPLNLLIAMIRFRAVPFADRLKIIFTLASLFRTDESKLNNISVKEFLRQKGQSERAISSFWEIISVGTLNTSTEKASALLFTRILKTVFLTGKKSSSFVLPKKPLSRVYVEKALEYIKAKGGEIHYSETVKEITESSRPTVKTSQNSYSDFDHIISSVQHHSLVKFAPWIQNKLPENLRFSYSPILTMHLFLESNPFHDRFLGLLGSPLQWVFNNGDHLSLLTSDAGKFDGYKKDELFELFCSELTDFFPIFYKKLVKGYRIIIEKRATFIPDISSTILREKIPASCPGMILAGDWVNTGLPATIEGAVLSGRLAADKIL